MLGYLCIIVLGIGIGIILWLRYRSQNPIFYQLPIQKHWLRFFYPIGYAIYLWIQNIRYSLLGKGTLGRRYYQLQSIYLKNQVEQELIVHESRKYTIIFLGVLCSCLAVVIIQICYPTQTLLDQYTLERPEYGEASAHYDLSVYGLDEYGKENTRTNLSVDISPKQYTQQEIDEIFDQLYEYLCEEVLGNNSSLDYVTQDLNFHIEIPYEGVTVEWIPSDLTLISEEGKIFSEQLDTEFGNVTEITADVSCGTYQTFYKIPIHLYPEYFSEIQKRMVGLNKEIQTAEEESNTEETYRLPEKYDGKYLTYYIQNEPVYIGVFLILFLALTVLLAVNYDFKLKEKSENRERQMQLDYSEIVCKFTVLIGAGMPIRGAWERIVQDYVNEKNKNQKYSRYAYEEMLYISYRMKSGLSEREAYAEYGKRCHMHSYLKLSSILGQNLLKGNQGIIELLGNETKEAFLEHQHLVRRMGEKMSTRLMLPMLLSFALVMIVIIFPAFLSFSVK